MFTVSKHSYNSLYVPYFMSHRLAWSWKCFFILSGYICQDTFKLNDFTQLFSKWHTHTDKLKLIIWDFYNFYIFMLGILSSVIVLWSLLCVSRLKTSEQNITFIFVLAHIALNSCCVVDFTCLQVQGLKPADFQSDFLLPRYAEKREN